MFIYSARSVSFTLPPPVDVTSKSWPVGDFASL